jgi:hypothetical protein
MRTSRSRFSLLGARFVFTFVFTFTFMFVVLGFAVAAQEGHPLAGTWYGDYGTAGQKNDLTVIMKWDGKSVTGTINPGAKATPIRSVVMNITPGKPAPEGRGSTEGTPPIFHVRIEADGMIFEGDILNPVAGNRRITGTWTRGNEKGSFQLRRL